MKQDFTAWAIDTRSDEGHGLVGRYWQFNDDVMYKYPAHLIGCKVALFKTRKIARENLERVRHKKENIPNFGFKKARVVKVKVTVQEAT